MIYSRLKTTSAHRPQHGCVLSTADAGKLWGWLAVAATSEGVFGSTLGHANSLEADKELQNKLGTLRIIEGSREKQIVVDAVDELLAFLAGTVNTFSVPIALHGTAFQQAVWKETNAIAFSSLTSYQDIAQRIGRPQAYRAVGNALRENALPVIVPCHRVIASDGSFGGYKFGLLWKERLLALEGSLDSVKANSCHKPSSDTLQELDSISKRV